MPLDPDSYFRCEHFACTMRVRHCKERMAATFPGANRWADGSVRAKRAGIYPFCSSGQCQQGKKIAVACGWDPRAIWSKGRYKFFADSVPIQRAAMRRYLATLPLEESRRSPPPDPLREAAETFGEGDKGHDVAAGWPP